MTAYALAVVLGICSLPSVTNILTWKEFAFVQSKLGWLCLCFGVAHDVLKGWSGLNVVDCHFFFKGTMVIRNLNQNYISKRLLTCNVVLLILSVLIF